MVLSSPNYISLSSVADAPISHEWDDVQPGQFFGDEVPRLQKRIALISKRGIVALGAASCEWIVWRLSKVNDDEKPLQFVEAAWASVIDWRYFGAARQPPREEWQGTIRGPLGATMRTLFQLVRSAGAGQPCARQAVYCANLAEHVLPKRGAFRKWRDFAIERLTKLHPVTPTDTTGLPVSRQTLDPEFSETAAQDPMLLTQFLATLQPTSNPYLRSPEEMKQLGFSDIPYTLDNN